MRICELLVAVLFATICMAPDTCTAEQLGRLFTTPEQRHELDQLRNFDRHAAEKAGIDEQNRKTEKKPELPGNSITVRGVVTRSDGENAAWINEGNSYQGSLTSDAIRVKPADIQTDKVKIVMPDDSTSVNVKVGETYEPRAKRIIDLVPPEAQQPTANGAAPSSSGRR